MRKILKMSLRKLLVKGIFYCLHLFRQKVSVMKEDWDVLIIADACRYDFAYKHKSIFGKASLKKKNSKGSSSPDFIKGNFQSYSGDTIVLSSNPYVSKLAADKFFLVVNVWSEAWDEEIGTVLPNSVFDMYVFYQKRYPDKRFILWLMQPHFPYVTNTSYNQGYNLKKRGAEIGQSTRETKVLTALKLVETGKLHVLEFEQIYNDEVEYVFTQIQSRLRDLKGKVVVTSDHGEDWKRYFGFPVFEHPSRVYSRNLVTVPWFEFETKERVVRRTTSKKIKNQEVLDGLTEKLRALGYHD